MTNPYFERLQALQAAQSQPLQLIRVTGIEGARAYQMPTNSTVALFDSNADLMYIKSTDGAGFPTVRVFEFKAYQEPQEPRVEYATRADLDALREEIMAYGKQPVRKSSAKPADEPTA